MPEPAEPPSREAIPPVPAMRRIRYRLEYAVLATVTAVLRALGVDRASALMGFLWRHLAPFNPRHRRVHRHLRRALPGMADAGYDRIAGDMWENLGRVAAETVLLPELLADPSRIECTMDLAGAPPKSRSKGALLVSLHAGNWELVSVPVRDAGFTVNAIYKPLRNPLSDAFLLRRRSLVYKGALLPREPGIALKMRSVLRGGGAIALLADLWDENGMTLDFFGVPASAALFPATMARRLGLPLLLGRSVRTHGARFRVDGEWLDMPHTADANADIEEITRRIHARFESWISENPSQWMWAHRKWHEPPA